MRTRILSCGACLFAVVLAAPVAASGQAAADKANAADRQFVMQAMEGGMAEVETGRLAAERATNADVKAYGQHMVDDHSKMLSEMRSMAKSKNAKLTAQPAKKHQAAMKKLQSAEGDGFDKAFMTQMVKDHEDALKLVQDASKNAKDKELKAAAQKAAPEIEKHLEMAKSIQSSLK